MRKSESIVFLFFFLLFIQSVFSQKSDEAIKDLNKRYPVLMKTYGDKLQNLEVEYIVAIDLSRSMNNIVPNGAMTYIDEVKRGINQFINAIPDNSKISIIGFGTTVRWVQIPTVINSANRASTIRVLNDLKADEDFTDLKGACNLLIEGCSSTSTIKYLFSFTDFNNDPPANSPFANTSWEDLQTKYALISKTSLIEAFALKLPIESNSGRDLPSIRKVFPGLNVIEFDAASLQNWFSDRCSKMMEQNLWTFVSKDLKKIQSESQFNLITSIGISGQVNLTSKMDLLPNYIQGLSVVAVEKTNLSVRNDFVFKASEIIREKNYCEIGNIISKDQANPLSFTNVFSGLLKGKFISPATDEISRLYAVVSLKQTSKDKINSSAESYLEYSQNISAGKGFVITWPLWLFIIVAIALLVFLILLLNNSILPYKLNGYGVRIDNGNLIKLEGRYKYILSTQKGDSKLSIPNDLEFVISGAKGDPFNFFIKKCLSIKIIKGKPTVRNAGVILQVKKKYRVPCSKEIIVSEGLSQVKLEFFRIKRGQTFNL
jgi:hypothetical protein